MQWIVRAPLLLLGQTTFLTNGTKFNVWYAVFAYVLILGKQYSSVYFQRILAAF